MKHSLASAQRSLFTDFPKGTMPVDERTRKESSEADPHIKRFETENRNWLVHYFDAYKDSDDVDNDKVQKTSINLEVKREIDQQLIHFPHFKEWRNGHFFSLRKWEGIVESVFETSFIARLKDVAHEVPDERVEIDFDELTNVDEKVLVKTGAIFSWTMGYSISHSGTRKRQAVLIFRRMPTWTEDDIKQGYKIADAMYATLGE